MRDFTPKKANYKNTLDNHTINYKFNNILNCLESPELKEPLKLKVSGQSSISRKNFIKKH